MEDVLYMCKRCGYNFKSKGNLLTHLRKVKPCNASHLNISRVDLIDELGTKLIREKNFECTSCQKRFTTRQGLSRHKLSACKQKPTDITSFLEKICDSFDKMTKAQPIHVNFTNNITSNSHNLTNNTININCFGDENIDHILSNGRKMINYLENKQGGVLKFIEQTNFDDEHPENKNVRLPNVKLPFLQIWNNKWVTRDRDEVLDDLINYTKNHFDEFFCENENFIKSKVGSQRLDRIECWIRGLKDVASGEIDEPRIVKLQKELRRKILALIVDKGRP